MTALLLAVLLQAAPDGCLRQAFGTYCVGGAADTLPKSERVSADGGRVAWRDAQGETIADIFEGKVVAVSRTYEPRSWLKWDELMGGLVEVFGPGEDRSKYPAHAKTREAQATNISLGRGRAAHRWAPAEGLVVMMAWDNEALFVSYVATELAARRKAKAKPAF